MIAFILRRFAQAIIVMLAVALVSFVMFRYMGDPITNLLGQEATVADRAAMMERLGLDRPVPVQYFDFITRAAQGDFGISYRMARPVSDVILERLSATLELAFVSGVLALAVGVGFGVYTALNRYGWLSNIVMTGSLIGVSLPTFLIGILLIWIFSVELGWLPSFGRGDTVDHVWWRTGFLT